MQLRLLLATFILLRPVWASFDGNINYASPSRRHARLGIDVSHVASRSLKRGNVPYDPSELAFTHGVASGDPWPESIILWTRVAPSNETTESSAVVEGTEALYSHETEKFIQADAHPICVEWKVFEAQSCGRPELTVAGGTAYTTSDIDFTVKVEATGLKPLTQYYYQFTICDTDITSPRGRTKTAPTADDDVSELRFAVFSCSNYADGYFNAYGNAARRDQHDYVIHLGDYIYEFASADYSARSHRADPDTQLLAKDFAWIATWDDHETADNAYRDGFNKLNNTEQSFLNTGRNITVDSRKVNAVRAYFEWMPIRQTDLDDGLRVWRSFQMGKLLDLIMLDTRNYDRSITTIGAYDIEVGLMHDEFIDRIRDDPSRTLMGARQESWFYRELSKSKQRGATWRLVGNQIIISRIVQEKDGTVNGDNWNGYVANRNRTLKHLYDEDIGNNIFLAGDSHQNWVSDLAWLGTKDYDPVLGQGAIGVEFAGTAASSFGTFGPIEPNAGDWSREMIEINTELMWQESYYRGYFLLAVTPESIEAQFFGSPSVVTRNPWDIPLANFTVLSGENHLRRPIAQGKAESGALKFGQVVHTNLTLNTETQEWAVVGFEKMY